MPRRTAFVAAAVVALTLVAAGTSNATDATAGSRAHSATAADEAPKGSVARGLADYRQRVLDARRSSVDLDSVVGTDERPNVLVLMTDDMRDDDLRFMPHVRQLIGDQGVRFSNMFSPQPLCCPARASFVTGLYSHNHGVWSQASPFGFRMLDDKRTMPVWLHQRGYDTKFLGKYLNGYGRQLTHDGRSSTHYVPPGWTDWRGAIDTREAPDANPLSGGTYRYFDTTLSVNGSLQPHPGEYQTHVYSRLTQDMIRDSAQSPRPFFAWISFTAPHGGSPKEKDDPKPVELANGARQRFQNPARPNYVKGRFDQRITQIPGAHAGADRIADKPFFIRDRTPMTAPEKLAVLEDYRQRVEALSVVDDEVVNIMETLKRTGELDNTYVLFTSDNGYFLGEHRMRQGKILPYDPSLRVPLLMRGPGIPAGEVRTDPFLMIDFAPTILDAAGGRAPSWVDGQSMLPVAEHGDRGWTRGILTETGPRVVGSDVEESDNFLVNGAKQPFALRFSIGVRTGRYLYVEHASHERELYDLEKDPRQFDNIVDEPRMRRVVRMLHRELERLKDCVGPECRRPLPKALQTDSPATPYVASPVLPPVGRAPGR